MPFMFIPLLFALAVPVPENTICIRNLGAESLYFTLDVRGGARSSATLAQGTYLCAEAPDGGFVSVFTDDQAIEGCSRLSPPGSMADLLQYADFDRCTWVK